MRYQNKIFLPAVNALLPLSGIWFFDWSIASIYGWFFVEFIFEVLFTSLRLRLFWKNVPYPRAKADRQSWYTIVPVGLVLAAMFFLLAVGSEGIQREELLPMFWVQSGFIAVAFCMYAWRFYTACVKGRDYRKPNFDEHTSPVNKKMIVIGVIYLFSIVQYHLFGGQKITYSQTYLLFLGTTIVVAKFVVEVFGNFLLVSKSSRQNSQ